MLRHKRRVLVIGCAGAGKTTFATELARITGLPLIYLDRHYWRPDLPRLTCLSAVLWRLVVNRSVRRPDLPDGCPETVDLELLRWIWNFPAQSRPRIVEALERVGDDVAVVRITRRGQARAALC